MATCNPLSSNGLWVANFRLPSVYFRRRARANAEKELHPRWKPQIIASITTGYSDTSAVVRDERNRSHGCTNAISDDPATVAASLSRLILLIPVY